MTHPVHGDAVGWLCLANVFVAQRPTPSIQQRGSGDWWLALQEAAATPKGDNAPGAAAGEWLHSPAILVKPQLAAESPCVRIVPPEAATSVMAAGRGSQPVQQTPPDTPGALLSMFVLSVSVLMLMWLCMYERYAGGELRACQIDIAWALKSSSEAWAMPGNGLFRRPLSAAGFSIRRSVLFGLAGTPADQAQADRAGDDGEETLPVANALEVLKHEFSPNYKVCMPNIFSFLEGAFQAPTPPWKEQAPFRPLTEMFGTALHH